MSAGDDGGDPALASTLEALESSNRGTVLVADDDEGVRMLLRVLLARQGFTVLDAENGLIALETARRERPDLVLLDWVMPIMDGHETVRQLKRDPVTRDIPVVMLTAQSSIDDKVAGLEAGAQDFLTKPFDGRELVARLEQQLRWRKLLADVPAPPRSTAMLAGEAEAARAQGAHREAIALNVQEAETWDARGEHARAGVAYRAAAREADRLGQSELANKLMRLAGKSYLSCAERGVDARVSRRCYLEAARCFMVAGNLVLAERSIDYAQSLDDQPPA
ncbi:MAG TPA: response regulator [Candidatus Baltobacteraceae bacterium]|nr:response regulator [Candidatus Baltobacteraceae bacterium]